MDAPGATLAARGWHALLALLALVALVGQAVLVVRSGSSVVDFLSYFTIQSNLLVLVAAVLVALGYRSQATWWRLLRLAGLVGITVTGIVYATLIAPYVEIEGVAWWYDKIFHYVVPLMAVLGHVLFRPRTTFLARDLAVLLWPVAWLGWTLARGAWGAPAFAAPGGAISRYPYDFLDVDANGAGAVVVGCLLVTTIMLVVAALYVRLTRSGLR